MSKWKPVFPSYAYKISLHICFKRGNVGAKVDFRGQFNESDDDFYGFQKRFLWQCLGVVCVFVVGSDICACVARRKNTHTLRASKIRTLFWLKFVHVRHM